MLDWNKNIFSEDDDVTLSDLDARYSQTYQAVSGPEIDYWFGMKLDHSDWQLKGMFGFGIGKDELKIGWSLSGSNQIIITPSTGSPYTLNIDGRDINNLEILGTDNGYGQQLQVATNYAMRDDIEGWTEGAEIMFSYQVSRAQQTLTSTAWIDLNGRWTDVDDEGEERSLYGIRVGNQVHWNQDELDSFVWHDSRYVVPRQEQEPALELLSALQEHVDAATPAHDYTMVSIAAVSTIGLAAAAAYCFFRGGKKAKKDDVLENLLEQ